MTFLDGHKAEMKAGICLVNFEDTEDHKGYSIVYECNKDHAKCYLGLGAEHTKP